MIKLNKKDRLELIITIILVIFFVFLFFSFLHRSRVAKSFAGHNMLRRLFTRHYFKYDPQRNKGMPFILDRNAGEITEIKRDPFSFGREESALGFFSPNLFLKGIILNSDGSFAVINDRILNYGEEINGYKIIDILPDKVILENKDSKLELKLTK